MVCNCMVAFLQEVSEKSTNTEKGRGVDHGTMRRKLA
jgi:hypothetical protein